MNDRPTPLGNPGRVPLVEIDVEHDLDTASSARLADLLDQALTLRPQQCVVDLSRCSALSATAINALMAAHLRAEQLDIHFALRAPSPKAWRNLRLARVSQVFDIVAGPDDQPPART